MMREIEISIECGQIIKAEVKEDGSCSLFLKVEDGVNLSKDVLKFSEIKKEETVSEDVLVLIEASKLSLSDAFMQHEPQNTEEKEFKELLVEVIKKGVKDFWRPKYDPVFTDNLDSAISYIPGKFPATGKSYDWWENNAKNVMPSRNSRLGKKAEYIAFLGVLIKKLVEDGWSITDSWAAVCFDSTNLGHYWNSKDARYKFEPTGSREVCGFYDLGNTFKLVATDENEEGYWAVGGDFFYSGYYVPLACMSSYIVRHSIVRNSTGWIVFD